MDDKVQNVFKDTVFGDTPLYAHEHIYTRDHSTSQIRELELQRQQPLNQFETSELVNLFASFDRLQGYELFELNSFFSTLPPGVPIPSSLMSLITPLPLPITNLTLEQVSDLVTLLSSHGPLSPVLTDVLNRLKKPQSLKDFWENGGVASPLYPLDESQIKDLSQILSRFAPILSPTLLATRDRLTNIGAISLQINNLASQSNITPENLKLLQKQTKDFFKVLQKLYIIEPKLTDLASTFPELKYVNDLLKKIVSIRNQVRRGEVPHLEGLMIEIKEVENNLAKFSTENNYSLAIRMDKVLPAIINTLLSRGPNPAQLAALKDLQTSVTKSSRVVSGDFVQKVDSLLTLYPGLTPPNFVTLLEFYRDEAEKLQKISAVQANIPDIYAGIKSSITVNKTQVNILGKLLFWTPKYRDMLVTLANLNPDNPKERDKMRNMILKDILGPLGMDVSAGIAILTGLGVITPPLAAALFGGGAAALAVVGAGAYVHKSQKALFEARVEKLKSKGKDIPTSHLGRARLLLNANLINAGKSIGGGIIRTGLDIWTLPGSLVLGKSPLNKLGKAFEKRAEKADLGFLNKLKEKGEGILNVLERVSNGFAPAPSNADKATAKA